MPFGLNSSAIGGLLSRGQGAAVAAFKNPAVQHSLIHGGIALGLGLGASAAHGITNSVQVGMAYSKMLQLYPELQRESPERVKLYFDAISKSSPDTAKNPLVVGSLVKRMMNYDGFDHGTFKDLVAIQGTFDKGRAGHRGLGSHVGSVYEGLGHADPFGFGAVDTARAKHNGEVVKGMFPTGQLV